MFKSFLQQEAEHLCKLFVGGLDSRTTDDSLKSHFEQYGEIVDVIVMKDPQTKRSRGFGFVAFSHSYMVDEALKNGPHVIDGKTVDTKRAIPRDGISKSDGRTVKKLFVGGIIVKQRQSILLARERRIKIWIGAWFHSTVKNVDSLI